MESSNFNIVTFDGGGLKGSLSITLFDRLNEEFPNIMQNINMLGGTSTGSLIALGLAYGLSPTKIKEFYSIDSAKYIFDKSYNEIFRPKYNNDNLKDVLSSIFPENLRLKDLGKLVVIPSFYLGSDNSEWKAIFYNNLPNSKTENARVIDVAMASSAAPIFFPTYNNHVDGGIIATDPSLACIIHAIDKELSMLTEEIKLLSIGTGYTYESIKEDTTDWGILEWMLNKSIGLPIISITLEGNCQMSQLFSRKLLKDNYYRLDPRIDRDIPMDSYDNLQYLISLGEKYDLDSVISWMKEIW